MKILTTRAARITVVAALAAVLLYFAFGTLMALNLTGARRTAPPPRAAGAELERVTVTSRDGLRLAGRYLAAPGSPRALVMIHGLGSRIPCEFDGRFVTLAGELQSAGFNILMLELRAHGESEGEFLSFGEGERWDVLGAADWLHRKGFARVGVLGISLGAVSTVRAGLEPDGPQEISAMVLDSCFGDFSDVLAHSFSEETGYPGFLLPGGLLMTRLLRQVDLARVRPIDELPLIKSPVFLIYGNQDRYVTTGQMRLMAAARPDAEYWLAAGAGHARIYNMYPQEYVLRVKTFLQEALR